jgi:hypothetical protein
MSPASEAVAPLGAPSARSPPADSSASTASDKDNGKHKDKGNVSVILAEAARLFSSASTASDKDNGKHKDKGNVSVILAEAARPSNRETKATVQHAAVATQAVDPAELFLEVVFRFWLQVGYSLSSEDRGQTIHKPTISFGQFVTDPPTVNRALEIWLSDGADLPHSAAVVPMLGLWFQDFELPTPDEESRFYAQWHSYSSGKRLLSGRRKG